VCKTSCVLGAWVPTRVLKKWVEDEIAEQDSSYHHDCDEDQGVIVAPQHEVPTTVLVVTPFGLVVLVITCQTAHAWRRGSWHSNEGNCPHLARIVCRGRGATTPSASLQN